MDTRERIKNIMVDALVETKLGTSKPSSKVADTREPVSNEGKPPAAGPRAGTKWYGERVKRMMAVKKAKGESLDDESDEVNEAKDPCWKGYTKVGMKKKGGRTVPNCVPAKGVPKEKPVSEAKSPAWQRSEGKNPEGGLNAKGRASAKAEGHNLKPPVSSEQAKKSKKSASRRKSFCARMSGMKKKLTSSKTASNPDSRINKSLRKWDC